MTGSGKYRALADVWVPEWRIAVVKGDIVEHGSPALKGCNAELFEKVDTDAPVTYAAKHRKAEPKADEKDGS